VLSRIQLSHFVSNQWRLGPLFGAALRVHADAGAVLDDLEAEAVPLRLENPTLTPVAKIERRLITQRGRFYKSKGMLWRTFHRLCDRYDHHDAVLNAGLVRAVQRLGRRFGPV
jgi:hypothetical protein